MWWNDTPTAPRAQLQYDQAVAIAVHLKYEFQLSVSLVDYSDQRSLMPHLVV